MKLPLMSCCLGERGGANGFLIPDHLSAQVPWTGRRNCAEGRHRGTCAVAALLPVGLESGSGQLCCCLQALSVLG